MATRADLVDWVYDALSALGGQGAIPVVAKEIWSKHEGELRASGDLFFTWQYDMRWAAMKLRSQGRLVSSDSQIKRGAWQVKKP